MAKIWESTSLHLDLLRSKVVAVVGYGNQGRAQALNLRDRGIDVRIGNPADVYATKAGDDGFVVRGVQDAVDGADLTLLLVPDEIQPNLYETQLVSVLSPGQTLVFASGYNVAFGYIKPPPELDVVLVAPRMIGKGVRELLLQGKGFPVLVGVANNATGKALDTALALAAAIGADLPGGCAIESSFKEEAIIDLFTEHTWAPATVFLMKMCCEMLIEAGVSPEAAILETYASGELGEIGRAMAELGLVGQMRLHSRTSQFGHLLWGSRYVTESVRVIMREALQKIEDGTFAEMWRREQEQGLAQFEAMWQDLLAEPIFDHEERLYKRLGRRSSRDSSRVEEPD